MHLNRKSLMICVLCLACPGLVFSESQLTFDDSGRPTTLVLGDVNVLADDSSAGFDLFYFDGGTVTKTRLSNLSTSGNEITVSHADGLPSFTFRVDSYDKHLAIHLLDAQGIGTGRRYGLNLTLETNTSVAAYRLNDLMTDSDGKTVTLKWPYLWGRPRPNGTRGSVVLHDDSLSGPARDAVLAEIWSVQGLAGHMVRPAGQATWTPADVLAWVDRWAAKFARLASVSLAPVNEQELYTMTETYAIPSGANRVYMFSTVWRGEYKLRYLSNDDVNTDVFPRGKADLIAYSDYLAVHGIHLQLKSLGPQIGGYNERYISSTFVDPRIMSWGVGTLAEDIDSSATTIRFRRDPNTLVVRVRTEEAAMRIGDEIVMADRITRTEDDVWLLEGCQRGFGGSTPKSHRAGTEMSGCDLSNDVFNFEDDVGLPNSIAEEICGEYGDFLNEVNVGHLHFDGTGRMGMYPWYVRDFTDYVYSRQDQPVTGSTVGGDIEANFEKQFSAVLPNLAAVAYRGIRVGLRLHQEGGSHIETATSMLDIHFDVSDGIMNGGRRPSLDAGQSGGALTMDILSNFGMTQEAIQLFHHWVELAPVFDDADADYVSGFMTKTGNHWKGEDVLVLSKNRNDDYIFTPHRVMGRTSGADEVILIDQEWGAIPRFQDIPAGTTMEMYNPYTAQQLQVVIRVEASSTVLRDPLITVNGTGTLSVSGDINPGEYMKFEGGNTISVYDENWNYFCSLPATTTNFTVNHGNLTVTTAAGSGGGVGRGGGGETPADLRVQYITLGPVYVLESNKNLRGNR